MDVQHIITDAEVIYENGAVVATSFVTNMDEYFIRSCPDLREAVRQEDEKNRKARKKEVPKYSYPDEVLSATMVGRMSVHGVEFSVKAEDCAFVRTLDMQRAAGKGSGIFGSGFLLSQKAAAEKAAAEKAAAEKAAAEKAAAEKAGVQVWELSEREKEIIRGLG